jgi:hypothetical protein
VALAKYFRRHRLCRHRDLTVVVAVGVACHVQSVVFLEVLQEGSGNEGSSGDTILNFSELGMVSLRQVSFGKVR